MYKEPKYLIAGDKAITVEFGDEIKEEINKLVRNMSFAINKEKIKGITEIIPTYRSVSIQYNPLEIGINELIEKLKEIYENIDSIKLPLAKIIEIPTVYGGEYGPDIEFVARHNNMSIEQVIKFHTSVDYLIYMLGFTPGFTYLGGLPKEIETPRLKTPRTKIPAGSTGIAGKQTGIYPIESPGGWQLIGRTPLKFYNPKRNPPIIFNAGDYLRFIPINEREYKQILKLVDENKYEVKFRNKE
ncbi:KipI family sensor histidine kinase inhibitor [Clostridium tetanomorphum]|uniref:5-oxoprolinase subunit PxpB n=1 Tax=Clostridium tetanomorphum TaxID=1553 RepID=A0A923J0H3_CLOTT|nr:5-oxoprolinase subunit PxpB [Clostridium tetanomorphum]KAJ51837.1 allophanate hydrolase subunit 1 [Clostridium tetanomorphum DSM 665]MBC2397719.1 5-oxoprolinase subunit PxpB [Clostridium tetanomorphum]MBP1865074.1 KipI family sensor histidine kinase inhibitor [Clostridium tetanomorphum]NRS83328.1 KipI family sensor histidine kinase inhibitor [Clostridium tetanomorphum]NRZ96528.1 KipI family sensor histidine kinase inhibitor [Clostridium tetanomorphum]